MDYEGYRRDIVGCVRLSFKLRAFSFKSRAFSLCKFTVSVFCTKTSLFNLDEIRDPFSPIFFVITIFTVIALE